MATVNPEQLATWTWTWIDELKVARHHWVTRLARATDPEVKRMINTQIRGIDIAISRLEP